MRKSVFPVFSPHKPIGESKTIPNQAFTVSDILAKFAGGAMLEGLERFDDLGDDVDEDIDTPFDLPRSGEMGDFDRQRAMDYVGTVEDEIKAHLAMNARHNLDNDVLDDTTQKNSSEKVVDVEDNK